MILFHSRCLSMSFFTPYAPAARVAAPVAPWIILTIFAIRSLFRRKVSSIPFPVLCCPHFCSRVNMVISAYITRVQKIKLENDFTRLTTPNASMCLWPCKRRRMTNRSRFLRLRRLPPNSLVSLCSRFEVYRRKWTGNDSRCLSKCLYCHLR